MLVFATVGTCIMFLSLSIVANPITHTRVSRENTREQPNHSSTAPEIHNTGLAHALLRAKTLTSFARPPHDLLHTFPRQLAPASSTTRAQRVSRENTREQPNHSSTAPEIHNTGLAHALLRAKTLTSFARPPHDLLHTFPRQVAFAARRCRCLSRYRPRPLKLRMTSGA